MGIQKKIKARMEQAMVKSYFKSWYKRWWGKLVLLIGILFLLSLVYFSLFFVNDFRHIMVGDVFNKELGTWISSEQYKDNQKDISNVLTEDDPFLGTDEPIVYIMAYESFGCVYCKENQADIKEMTDKFGPIIRFVVKDFPTEGLHENVFDAHLAAGCAQEQGKFWEYRDLLFANQNEFAISQLKRYAAEIDLSQNEFSQCLSNEEYAQEIRQDYAQGVDLGVTGTPSYVVNGQLMPGTIPMALWEEIIGFIIKQN
ncbi:DsbA family protein [bacterium]|jgi:protein-disulfide isomerase|nr:DsbA family protein [bacterium]